MGMCQNRKESPTLRVSVWCPFKITQKRYPQRKGTPISVYPFCRGPPRPKKKGNKKNKTVVVLAVFLQNNPKWGTLKKRASHPSGFVSGSQIHPFVHPLLGAWGHDSHRNWPPSKVDLWIIKLSRLGDEIDPCSHD